MNTLADLTSSNVIKDLQHHCEEKDYTGLFYFYIDGSAQSPLTIESLYRSLIAQLITGVPELSNYVEYIYERYGPGGYDHDKPIPTDKWDMLMSRILMKLDRVYVVLDGLDECEDSIGFEGIAEFINKLLDEDPYKVHAIAFSRNLEQLRSLFSTTTTTTIPVEEEALAFDLKRALHFQLSTHPKFSRWPRSLKQTIEASLLGQAHGS